MDPGRFASARVLWGVSVFLLQPNVRGRFHFLRGFFPRLGLASLLAWVLGPSSPLGCFGKIFGKVLC